MIYDLASQSNPLIDELAWSDSTGGPTGATTEQRVSKIQDCMVAVGIFLVAAGTGGFSKSVTEEFQSPSSTHISIETRPVPAFSLAPGISYRVENEAIAAADRIGEIRARLSLNVKQLADVLLVARPSVYGWMRGAFPREGQQARLKQIYDVARRWSTLSSEPVGKYLITPLASGVSLAALLRAPTLDQKKIDDTMEIIRAEIENTAKRKVATGYKSASSIIKTRKIKPAIRAVQEQRLDESVDLS